MLWHLFSHMLSELKAVFPQGVFAGDSFRITKRWAQLTKHCNWLPSNNSCSDAADFWRTSFGERTIVPWKMFRLTLNEVIFSRNLQSPTQMLLTEIMRWQAHVTLNTCRCTRYPPVWRRWRSSRRSTSLATTTSATLSLMSSPGVTQEKRFLWRCCWNKPTISRLFQPWSTLLRNWQILAVTHPGYVAFLTYDEVPIHISSFLVIFFLS